MIAVSEKKVDWQARIERRTHTHSEPFSSLFSILPSSQSCLRTLPLSKAATISNLLHLKAATILPSKAAITSQRKFGKLNVPVMRRFKWKHYSPPPQAVYVQQQPAQHDSDKSCCYAWQVQIFLWCRRMQQFWSIVYSLGTLLCCCVLEELC